MAGSGVEGVGCRQGRSMQREPQDGAVQSGAWWEAESRAARGQVNIVFKEIVFKGCDD